MMAFFTSHKFSMLYCTARTAKRILGIFPRSTAERLTVTNGWVAQIKCVDKKAQGVAVLAEKSDFHQIVSMIYEDEGIGRSYEINDLAKQLEERNQEGYARNLVIKRGNMVIAHACTNAEYEDISVVAELLVRREYRKKGYASEIWRDLCDRLLSEHKEVYSFYYSEESRMLHKRIGFFELCEWTKIVFS